MKLADAEEDEKEIGELVKSLSLGRTSSMALSDSDKSEPKNNIQKGHIALGLASKLGSHDNSQLIAFAKETSSSWWHNWEADGIITAQEFKGTREDMLDAALAKATRIHFDLSNFKAGAYRAWLTNAESTGMYEPTNGGSTNYELWSVLPNKVRGDEGFANKTTFYLHGEVKTSSQVSGWLFNAKGKWPKA